MSGLKLCVSIFIVFILSLFIMLKQPVMHKQAMITDSEYSFVEEDFTNRDVRVVNNNIQPEFKPPVVNNVRKQPERKYKQPVTRVSRPQNPVSSAKPEVPVKQAQAVQEKKEVKPPAQVNTQPQAIPKKELTEQEEIIAWNRWRSALQNQVMYDTRIAAPLGTAFKFSFTVDKYGNMSNVKVWSTNPAYSDMAVRAIKPVLMSYQHKPILNFPQGTKRIITNVNGGFVISRTTEYSTPSDYSDYERVKRRY